MPMLFFEEGRRRVIDDLRRDYEQLWKQSVDGEIQQERDWYAAKCEALEEAIASIAMGILQPPLSLEELKHMKVVWVEYCEDEETVPAFVLRVSDEYIQLRCYEGVVIEAPTAQYGKYWRAWAYEPTEEEREEGAWREDGSDL